MKNCFLLFILLGCTQKYATYDLIQKVTFNKENYLRPTSLMEVVPNGNDSLESCFNQWLFFSNAQSDKESSVPFLVRSLCPHHEYLLDANFVESWWTILIFTRACVSIDSKCAALKKSMSNK